MVMSGDIDTSLYSGRFFKFRAFSRAFLRSEGLTSSTRTGGGLLFAPLLNRVAFFMDSGPTWMTFRSELRLSIDLVVVVMC